MILTQLLDHPRCANASLQVSRSEIWLWCQDPTGPAGPGRPCKSWRAKGLKKKRGLVAQGHGDDIVSPIFEQVQVATISLLDSEGPEPIPIALGDPAIPEGEGDDNEVAAALAGCPESSDGSEVAAAPAGCPELSESSDDSEAQADPAGPSPPCDDDKGKADACPEVPGRASDSG